MISVLEFLVSRFPLGEAWESPELFSDEISLGGLKLQLAGLSTQNSDGLPVVSSAAQTGGDPTERCYFELLERTAIVEAAAHRGARLELRNSAGQTIGDVGRDIIFPVSPNPDVWRFARSNGIAAHTNWEGACASAAFELIERDAILRSWVGEQCPRVLAYSGERIQLGVGNYTWEAYRFDENLADGPPVVGVFGFPGGLGLPLVFGFGARDEEGAALEAAERECLQRLGFLWGEELPLELPNFSPTPDYHQEYFLHASSLARIRRWLKGGHYRSDSGRRSLTASGTGGSIQFVDLTPTRLENKVWVAKAVSVTRVPLVFGISPWIVGTGISEDLFIHPIA